jgi:uncharacterized protein (TIGR00730 family)
VSVRRWCVFCGSSTGRDPRFLAAASELGAALAGRGIEVVYGGARIGLMGAVADAAIEAGGRVTGIIPKSLDKREVGHRGVTDLRIVESMHERKALMADLSEGFIALPGGFGTFEEYTEAVTWVQLGIQHKPTWLVNIAGYYDPLVAQFDRAVAEGFVSVDNRAIVEVFPTVAALIARLPE